jgi:YQGE family putative transporter
MPTPQPNKAQRIMSVLANDARFSHDLVYLYLARIIQRISLGALGVFIPIYFFVAFHYDLAVVIAIFVALSGLYIVGLPWCARLLRVVGTRALMMWATVFAGATSFVLYLFPDQPALAALLCIIAGVGFRLTYWIPYHVSLSSELDPAHRGSQIAFLANAQSLLLAFVPMLGGALISVYGFDIVFLLSTITMAGALIPLLFITTTYEQYSWTYLDTFSHLLSRQNRSLFVAHFANGAQSTALLIFWPLYIFMLLDQQYSAVGIIATLTVLGVMLLRWLTGYVLEHWHRDTVLRMGVLFASVGWTLKLFVQTPTEIFVVDTFHNFGDSMNTTAFDAVTYEQASDNGRFVDEYTVLKEMALHAGRVAMLLAVGGLLMCMDMRVAFVLAACITLAMILIGKRQTVR